MGGSRLTATSHFPYCDLFDACFPTYLSYGMTYEQYWQGDCTLVRAYRKAEAMRVQRANQMAWLQGRYFYEALCDASPLFRFTMKSGTIEPLPYIKEPYPLTEAEVREREQRKVQEMEERMKADMLALATRMIKKQMPGEAHPDNEGGE